MKNISVMLREKDLIETKGNLIQRVIKVLLVLNFILFFQQNTKVVNNIKI